MSLGEDGGKIDGVGPEPWLNVPMGLHSEVPIDGIVDGAGEGVKKCFSSY